MGILNLSRFLRTRFPQVYETIHLSSLSRKRVAIDLSIILCKTKAVYGDGWLNGFKNFAATTRGIGWAVLWHDPRTGELHTTWVDEQHLGQLNGCTMILALDMWEHSYVADYQPSGKKQYVEDFFANLNWEVVEGNFMKAR